jgi:hypothetical protein
MEKKLSLPELVKRYLAQPFTNFNYPDTSSDTPEEKKEEEETKKPIVYIPPSGDGGDGGIGSLNPYGGNPITGGFDGGYGADPITGDLPGGGNIVDEFGTLGDVYAGTGINNIPSSGDLPGGGNLYDEFNPPGSGPISGGGGYGFSGAGPGVNPTTGEIVGGGNIVDEFGGPGFGSLGTGIGGGQGLGADANDGFADGQDFGADANDGFGNQDTGVSVGQDNTPNLGDRDTFNPETGSENSSGRKIVCTMMNQSYGFGSFRNKIWLKHSKGLAPEYQKGYHKIFLPLIKIAETNKIVRKILEHIAVHRTIDIRQESRGKVHLLGRAYRKILEPICYFVGKHG